MPESTEPEAVSGALLFMDEDDGDALDACPDHDDFGRSPLKLSQDGDVFVTPEGTYLYYCPTCVRQEMDELADTHVVDVEQAVTMMLRGISREELEQGAGFLVNLGRGEVHDGGVYLVDNPSVDEIPNWLYGDGGVFFIDEAQLDEERARAAERFHSLFER